jgi:hypothetical protein
MLNTLETTRRWKMAELAEVEKVRDAARALRLVNLVAAVAAVCWIVFLQTGGTEKAGSPGLMHTVAALGMVVTPALLALGAYRLSRNIDVGPPLLWTFGSILGCFGVLVVLRLCHYATQWFRKQGLKVGLLGPTAESLTAYEETQTQAPLAP